MGKKENGSGWLDILKYPFVGKKFFIYFSIAFLVFIFIREPLKEEGIILGGLGGTLLLFGLTFFIGLISLTFKMKNTDENEVEEKAKNRPAWAKFLSKNKWFIILGILLLWIVGTSVKSFYADKQEVSKQCLQLVEYNPSKSYYSIEENGNTIKFKTQKEALNYCEKIIVTEGVDFQAER